MKKIHSNSNTSISETNLCITLFLIVINFTFGHNNYESYEFCVINSFGAKVYEQPNFDSRILNVLEMGESVLAKKHLDTNEKIKIDAFYLEGIWLEAVDVNGYLFSSDLTNKKAEIKFNRFGKTIHLLGKLLSEKKIEEKHRSTNNIEYSINHIYKSYKNGTVHIEEGDGCYTEETTFNNLSLNEVYHLTQSKYGKLQEFQTLSWEPIYVKNNRTTQFSFSFEATELYIIINKEGKTIISSSSCD